MELPKREPSDRFTPPGRYRELEGGLRQQVHGQDIPILFVYAFDRRTRLGPFMMVDKCLVPGAPRAVGSALHAAGMTNVRLVMQPWNPNLRPSQTRFDGRPPEVLMVSAMQIHSAPAYDLIRDAWLLGDDRPLIMAGGAKAIYEPWDFFGLSPDGQVGADVVVTGEEFVMLELFDRIVQHKGPNDSMRQAFNRVRREGLLEDIPGLVYRPDDSPGAPQYLVNTGVQRLVQNLDELPLPFDAMGLFEPPHNHATLSPSPVPIDKIGRHAKIMAMVTTHGCKFGCHYCPIPAYNQRTFRYRSAERLTDEIAGITERTGIRKYFGTDDNVFNDREIVQGLFDTMARGRIGGKPFRKAISFATEATELDVYKHQDLIPLAREGGLRSLWFGLEDLTAGLVQKGQTPEKTKTVFKLLLKSGIAPMPMMMHHDSQPLWSWRNLRGLVNQVGFLRRVGAITCQITLLTPSVGSKSYEQTFDDGLVLSQVGGKPVEEYQFDGNHIVATEHESAFWRQLNMLAGYAAFYNPVNLLRALPRFDSLWTERVVLQLYGMWGLAKSTYQIRDWLWGLISGPIEHFSEFTPPKFPMVVPRCVETRLAQHHFRKNAPASS